MADDTRREGRPEAHLDALLRRAARHFPYPPAPAPAKTIRAARPLTPRWAWAGAALALLIAASLSVPEVRAGLLRLLAIGGVTIQLEAPTPTPPRAGTPAPTPTLLPSLMDLEGETTVEAAQAGLGVTIPLPAHPPDLGQPDHVFLQDFGGPMAVLVWLDDARPGRVRLSLHLLTCEVCATKSDPVTIDTTRVNGRPAVWTAGPYLLHLEGRGLDLHRLIDGHVLIWTDGGLTYRLETELSMDEAVLIAESLR